ncbi:histone-lysine N-methyltransferase SETMAR [Plakobranchus ocellatus]|uniref:Histone-lysine N-methyltransferase SETMAR n=1 Tax=Plakobranchus ocellatus TaxID=259542 RepID=A0AAV4BSJ4_9GAST|nr:histone-lysine N-methyltransferase SETMAR [Plakobranchus ocellatus]
MTDRPKTSTNEENTTRVDELIRCDRRMKIRDIALKLEIPKKDKARLHDLETSIFSRHQKLQSADVRSLSVATVFWDAKGVILLDILPQGQCINAARYCSTLDRLKEAIRRKRPGLLRRGVVLQHDNATPHSANLT